MKKLFFLVIFMAAFAFLFTPAMATKPTDNTCATIQGGTLVDTKDNAIGLGYDQWGYNYQAHMFNGWYDNYLRPNEPVASGDRVMQLMHDVS